MRLIEANVEAHYARQGLDAAILTALQDAGVDLNQLKAQDLAPIDEFHIGGRKFTLELAHPLNLDDSMQLLDVGCGLGGPSRVRQDHPLAGPITPTEDSGDKRIKNRAREVDTLAWKLGR